MTVMAFLMTGAGLVLLFLGGEVLLRGAISIALRSGLPPLLIGLTIVSLATSMPELMVTVTAGLEGATDVGVGNVVGSNIANILLILGAAAMVKPILINPRQLTRDTVALLFATAVFIVLALMGTIDRIYGAAMLIILFGYYWLSYYLERRTARADSETRAELEETGGAHRTIKVAVCFVVIGVAALAAGSELLVQGSVSIARAAGVSEAVIGLTLVAFGTSLPELATSMIAALRGHTDVALGNVLGSNIANILMIIGALASIVPFQVSPEIIDFDMWVMVGVTLLLLPVIFLRKRMGRLEGFAFVALYVLFVLYQFDPHRLLSLAA